MTAAEGVAKRRWPLERALFALAGTMVLASAILSALVSPWFLLLTAFVGGNQLLFVAAGKCPASIILRRACGLTRAPAGRTPEASRWPPGTWRTVPSTATTAHR